MKKIAGAIAILLSIAIFLIHRQRTTVNNGKSPQQRSVCGILEENLILSSLLIQ